MISANNSASEQAAHIQDMIVKGANAIVILAASDTALNGVIRDACNAGIVVVVMASLVTEPCAYTVDYNWSAMGRVEMDYIAGRLKGTERCWRFAALPVMPPTRTSATAFARPLATIQA